MPATERDASIVGDARLPQPPEPSRRRAAAWLGVAALGDHRGAGRPAQCPPASASSRLRAGAGGGDGTARRGFRPPSPLRQPNAGCDGRRHAASSCIRGSGSRDRDCAAHVAAPAGSRASCAPPRAPLRPVRAVPRVRCRTPAGERSRRRRACRRRARPSTLLRKRRPARRHRRARPPDIDRPNHSQARSVAQTRPWRPAHRRIAPARWAHPSRPPPPRPALPRKRSAKRRAPRGRRRPPQR